MDANVALHPEDVFSCWFRYSCASAVAGPGGFKINRSISLSVGTIAWLKISRGS